MGEATKRLEVKLSEVRSYTRTERGKFERVGAFDRMIDKSAHELRVGDMIHHNDELHRVESVTPLDSDGTKSVVLTNHITGVTTKGAIINGPFRHVRDRDTKVTVVGHAPKHKPDAVKAVWKKYGPHFFAKTKISKYLLRKAIPGSKPRILSLAASIAEQDKTWSSQQPFSPNQEVAKDQLMQTSYDQPSKEGEPAKISPDGVDVYLHPVPSGGVGLITKDAEGTLIHHGEVKAKNGGFEAKPNGEQPTTHGSISDAVHHVMENGQPISQKEYASLGVKPTVTGGTV